jgi:hypothetical protein
VTLFHRVSVEWSYLSIDIFQEPGGTDFHYNLLVTGSQAGNGHYKVYVMKWPTSMQGGDDREDSDDRPD